MPTAKKAKDNPINQQFIQSEDGTTHINVNSGAKTELGSLLSTFAKVKFVHPVYGPFASVEAFWHWIRDEERDDTIRALSGYKAKIYGRRKKRFKIIPNFQQEVILAFYFKIVQNQQLYDLFVASELPFKCYYIFGETKLEIVPNSATWVCSGLEFLRKHIKEHGKNNPPALNEIKW